MKGLIRKRSTTAARLQRALSAKNGLNKDESTTAREEANTRPEKRQFLMETAVQFTTVGVSNKFSSSLKFLGTLTSTRCILKHKAPGDSVCTRTFFVAQHACII
jgi:hypothetical protein